MPRATGQKLVEKMTLAQLAFEISLELNEGFLRERKKPLKDRSLLFDESGSKLYFPSAHRRGSFVVVKYVDYEIGFRLNRQQASHYLVWLRNGNIGTHWRAGIDA